MHPNHGRARLEFRKCVCESCETQRRAAGVASPNNTRSERGVPEMSPRPPASATRACPTSHKWSCVSGGGVIMDYARASRQAARCLAPAGVEGTSASASSFFREGAAHCFLLHPPSFSHPSRFLDVSGLTSFNTLVCCFFHSLQASFTPFQHLARPRSEQF
jgi:hypothetical protein